MRARRRRPAQVGGPRGAAAGRHTRPAFAAATEECWGFVPFMATWSGRTEQQLCAATLGELAEVLAATGAAPWAPADGSTTVAEVCAARAELERDVAAALPDAKVHEGCANFFLVDLPAGISATDVVERCRELGVYLRAVGDDRIRIAVRSGPENARIALALLEVCGEEDARRIA